MDEETKFYVMLISCLLIGCGTLIFITSDWRSSCPVVEQHASVPAPERQYYEIHVNTSADTKLYLATQAFSSEEKQELLRSYCDLLSRVNKTENQSLPVAWQKQEYSCWSNKVNDTIVYCNIPDIAEDR